MKFLANFSVKVKDCATVGAHMDMLHPSSALSSARMAGLMPSLHIQAWASALPSDFDRAMREASTSRTVTDTDSYAFFIFQPNANEGKTAAFECLMTEDLKNLCVSAINTISRNGDGQFDSHDVINFLYQHQNTNITLTALWNMVDPEEQSKIRHRLHLEIGKWIENNQDSLGIEFLDKQKSPNYRREESLNANLRRK